jgi:hypothetical protein
MGSQDQIKKQCPTCGKWDVYRAYLEDGGMGDWCPHCNKSLEYRKRISPIIGLAGVILVILGYVVVNSILHYGQEIYHKPQIEQCELLDKELSKLKAEIDIYKNNIELTKQNLFLQKIKIDEIENKLKYPEKNYISEKSYDKDYKMYKKLIKDYNTQVEKNNQSISNCKSLIEQYNLKVGEYNTLAKTAYSKWYVIPIPGKISKGKN